MQAKDERSDILRLEQSRLAERGVPIMVLQYLAAADGVPGDMVAKTLGLGIKALNGGNKKTQTVRLMSGCDMAVM